MRDLGAFEYLRNTATKYGIFYLVKDFEEFVNRIDDLALKELREAYMAIRRKDDVRVSRLICDTSLKGTERVFSNQLGCLFNLFDHLGKANISPFSSFEISLDEEYQRPDWNNLPEYLGYLIDPAEEYGIYVSEDEMLLFLENAHEKDRLALAEAAERIQADDHLNKVYSWLNKFPFQQHAEAWQVYCLLGVLDHAGLL